MSTIIYIIGCLICASTGLLAGSWLMARSARRLWRTLLHLHDTHVLARCIRQLRADGKLWTPLHQDSPFTDE